MAPKELRLSWPEVPIAMARALRMSRRSDPTTEELGVNALEQTIELEPIPCPSLCLDTSFTWYDLGPSGIVEIDGRPRWRNHSTQDTLGKEFHLLGYTTPDNPTLRVAFLYLPNCENPRVRGLPYWND